MAGPDKMETTPGLAPPFSLRHFRPAEPGAAGPLAGRALAQLVRLAFWRVRLIPVGASGRPGLGAVCTVPTRRQSPSLTVCLHRGITRTVRWPCCGVGPHQSSVSICVEATTWPLYKLSNHSHWPPTGTFDFTILQDLDNFCQHTEKLGPGIFQTFRYLSSWDWQMTEVVLAPRLRSPSLSPGGRAPGRGIKLDNEQVN
ncbi:uncharacterized protein LOC142452363 [Tenrec ecaudatus]|uniref:uncharacterized protein LOC142452363 n=1 Tax=Tenrec ecaudatus TaxID=94439 RepID=UPI003F5A625A